VSALSWTSQPAVIISIQGFWIGVKAVGVMGRVLHGALWAIPRKNGRFMINFMAILPALTLIPKDTVSDCGALIWVYKSLEPLTVPTNSRYGPLV